MLETPLIIPTTAALAARIVIGSAEKAFIEFIGKIVVAKRPLISERRDK
jgi:hypothetical protein